MKRVNFEALAVAGAFGVAALASAPITAAQTADRPAPSAERQGIEEIVVTSRRREENLQQTPVSVLTFSTVELEKANVTNLLDLGTKLPNVNLAGAGGAGTNNASFYIRGLGSGSRNSVNSENSVGIYIDDAYYGKTDGAILDVIDVERIEVLRGPQGTLFGRNSTAGAIRYITKKPHFDGNDGYVKVATGNFSRRDIRGAANLVLTDNFATRLTVASLKRDGYVHNAITGAYMGDEDTLALRGAFLFRPSEDLDVQFNIDYAESDTNGAPTVATAANLTPNGGIWQAPFAPAELAENLARYGVNHATVPTDDFYTSYSAEDNYSKRDTIGANLVFDYAVNDRVSFKSATTYREMDTDVFYDMDGLPAELNSRAMVRNIDVFTQEFQLSGSTSKLEWLGGVFYLLEEASSFQDDTRMLNAFTAANISPYGIEGGQLVDPHETKSTAIFGETTYSFNDAWAVTTGLRYTKDDKNQTVYDLPIDVPQIPENVVLEAQDEDSWDAFSGRLGLEWTVSDDVFAFATYSRGFRGGGINDEGAVIDGGFGTYDEEIIDSYEIGFRSDLLDNRLRLNMTAFYMEAHDLQFTVLLDPNESDTVIQNAGEAEIRGLETEITAILSDYVTFSLDVGILDTEFLEVPPLERSDDLDPIEPGDPLTNAPELSYNANLEFYLPVSDGDLTANINYGYKDDYSLYPGITSNQDAYGLLGANISYTSPDGKWQAQLFGTNLTDEEYANIIMDIGGSAGIALGYRMVEPARPREYGVSLTYNFQ